MGNACCKEKRDRGVSNVPDGRSNNTSSDDLFTSMAQQRDVAPSYVNMASSNEHEGNDDVTSGEITLPSDQLSADPNIAAGINALAIHSDHLEVTSNTFQISAGATRQGTLDSKTLKLKLTDAQNTFVPTKSFKDIKRCLEQNCHVTICGASGEGKTTMALMLGDKYRKQGYELVFVDRPEVFDLGSCISSGQKFCLIFDDIFGADGQSTHVTTVKNLCNALKLHIDNNLQTRLNEKTKMKLGPEQAKLDDKKCLQKTQDSNEIRVIFTSKTYNFHDGISKCQYQHISMFTKKTVKDLTVNPESPYSREEKRKMFEKHKEMHPNKQLGDLEVEEVINQDSSLFGFPLTCRLFFEFYRPDKATAVDFFRRPVYYLRIELNDILSRRNEQAAALILVLLCEGNIKLPHLESKNKNDKVDEMLMHVSSFTNSASRSSIASAARSFRGTFLSRGDNLCFSHSSIYDAFACALYQFNPSLVLEFCSFDFLYERLKPLQVQETGVSDTLHYLFVSEEYFPEVITRFVSAIKKGLFSKTVAHPIMQNEKFVKKFLEDMRKFASDNKTWIEWKDTEKCFLYWVVKSKEAYLAENIGRFLQVTFTDDDIREALLAAVECDSLILFKLLIGKLKGKLCKIDVNKNLLTSAKSSGDEIVEYLLKMGADVSSTDQRGRTFLHLLCVFDRPAILELVATLINKENVSLALNKCDDNGNTPLMLAALHGTWNCFKLIKNNRRASVKESENLIHLACKGGNLEIVKSVLTHTDNLNKRNQYGRTPIMQAAFDSKPDVFDLLLSKRADVTLVGEDGDTLLHHACIGGNTHIVERLLTPQNINSRGWYELTPLMVAAQAAKPDVFDLLLSYKADVTLVDEGGNLLLHHACIGGNTQIVERILTPQNINSRDWCEWTPIMVAAQRAKPYVFDLLLSKRADVTLVDEDGDTLLHLACYGGNTHIVERLLTPQNINSRGQYELTPLMVAAQAAKPYVFDLLLSKRADVTLVDEDENSLLHYACHGGNTHIVERILTPQNINIRGRYELTPLMVAAEAAKPVVFDLLLTYKADVTLVDEGGNLLLHHACIGGNTQIVERILTPQNINSRGQYEWTPIMVAAEEAKPDVFDLLLSHEADITLVDEYGNTLLHHACIGGNTHIVERILTPQNINSRGRYERTPIMVAALEEKPDVFDLLLSKGADVTLVDEGGDLLLHYACFRGITHIVERVQTPQNINSRGLCERTPIMVAAYEAKPDVFDLLSSHKANVTLLDEYGDTLLHHACIGGNTHIVERLLTPQNINSRGWYELTPLMVAAQAAKPDVFDLLLSYKADVTLVDEGGNLLLHHACIGGNTQIVERILTPQNINSRDWCEWTPIMVAAQRAKPYVFDLLLSKRADVTLVDEDGDTLLHLACYGGNTHIVERLLTPQNINSRGQYELTPLMVAAQAAKPYVFDLLLSKRADVTLVDEDENSLLHYACHGGNTHIVERILTPQNINIRGRYELTPLMVAAEAAKPVVFDLLLTYKADVTLVDEGGNLLLHHACIGGNTQIVERILTPQNINSRGQYEWTPIMVAAEEAKPDVFDLLLSHEADITLVDEYGNTLLHHACIGGNTHIVERILTPQNINSRGRYERTPIMVAALEEKPDVFDLLLSKGADVTLVDEGGDLLLHYACFRGITHIVERVQTPQNINSRGLCERTPIMVAAYEAKPDVFDLLSSHKANVTLLDEYGDTLLHLACIGGNTHFVENVLTPQNINSKGMDGFTPILVAAQKGHIKIVEYLCEKGADLTSRTSDSRDVVAVAEDADKEEVVKYLKSRIN